MISRILAAQLPAHVGHRVRIAGWVHRQRHLKSVTFVVVRDRSGLAQVVFSEPPEGIGEETVVEVSGLVAARPQAPGGVELVQPELTLLSEPGGGTAVRPLPAGRVSYAAHHSRQCAGRVTASATAGAVRDHRGQCDGFSRRPGRSRLH
ncbi:OB-fold nucleic acid binding domain-containing protein [Fodinicola feengrottensis]|uniref:OB-fold nucleic acid binding domain-containing protein n=1 Tax=Fodinicola feengrottensis TaxID=435914 RepID=UPI002440F3FC|nr:OB-fold nucleic acid binding domain-containing protein [Fodinicola feengrottensis]